MVRLSGNHPETPRTAYTDAYTVSGARHLVAGPRRRQTSPVAESYYAARAARDPEWRLRAIAAAVQGERARRERDPEGRRARRREATARCRARQAAAGFTFHELWLRVGPRTGAGRDHFATMLAQEVAAGGVDYLASSRRYRLNGGLPDDVKAALRDLEL